MKNLKLQILIILLLMLKISGAQDTKEIWNYISNNDRSKALSIIQTKLKANKATTDDYITYNLLKSFDGTNDKITDFMEKIRLSENQDSYIYSLWFTPPVTGTYGNKTPHQLALLRRIIENNVGNGTLRAAAHYSLGHHYIATHQFALIRKENNQIGALSEWQFVGPFNNISGSGFNKNYEPIRDPSNNSIFSSVENAPIQWFTPVEKSNEAWIFPSYFISKSSGSISFAQTFVQSAVPQDVYICTGFTGSIKVWVNDQLVINVPEERITELDTYNTKCHLNAGYNRVLVQIGADNKESNFIVRLTNSSYEPLTNITSTSIPQPYQKTSIESEIIYVPLFAESFFISKIKNDSANLVNYILLERIYLRNKKVFDARKTIEQALKLAPNNSLLKYELFLCYSKENNRTGMSEIYEYFKEHEKQSLIGYVLRIDDLQEQEKYQEALDTLETQIKIYGIDDNAYEKKIQLLSKIKLLPQLIETVYEANKAYPNDPKFINYVFNIEKNINKNSQKALKILDSYLINNFNYELIKLLIDECFSQNNSKKAYKIFQEMLQTWPYDPQIRLDLLNEYISQQKYTEAYDLCKFMLRMKPFSGYYYDSKASIEESLNKKQEAIETYLKALVYQPSLYESRDKLRKLQNKISLFDLAKHDKIENLIKKTGANIKAEEFDYYYIQYEKAVVIYPEGGREEEQMYAIKILNQRGIDEYKETSISYSSNTESLIIEDAQLIKSNGKKIKPEINDNQIVWTGLEINDIIYVKCKKRIYLQGKFAQEFYDKYIFDGFIPVELAKYSLIIPNSKKIHYQVLNGEIQPTISEYENYKVYIWEKNITSPIKDEPYMPAAADFASTLHISTIGSWDEIAQWYSDLVYSKIANDNDYEVIDVYNKLFAGKANLIAAEKAKIIYDYIAKNINYSSVAFRQSGLIPQKASETINTHLGDCKDISTLFVSLANLCDLKSNLVLVSTRDNGKKDMFLPSFLFNHCIVKYFDEKKTEHYLELTDRYLPFKSLPDELFQAMSLTIPSKDEKDFKSVLTPISAVNSTLNKNITKTKVDILNNEMNITYLNSKHGSLSNWSRKTYRALNQENTNKKMQESIGEKFNNPILVNNVSFTSLDEEADSIKAVVDFSVKNEVKRIGSQFVFSIPYIDKVVTTKPFNLEKRNYDFEYWKYEDANEYSTQIEINIPSGKVFAEIPKNEKLYFNKTTYSLDFRQLGPNKLSVIRRVHIDRNNITPEQYIKFKEFISKIVEAEGTYIAYK